MTLSQQLGPGEYVVQICRRGKPIGMLPGTFNTGESVEQAANAHHASQVGQPRKAVFWHPPGGTPPDLGAWQGSGDWTYRIFRKDA